MTKHNFGCTDPLCGGCDEPARRPPPSERFKRGEDGCEHCGADFQAHLGHSLLVCPHRRDA